MNTTEREEFWKRQQEAHGLVVKRVVTPKPRDQGAVFDEIAGAIARGHLELARHIYTEYLDDLLRWQRLAYFQAEREHGRIDQALRAPRPAPAQDRDVRAFKRLKKAGKADTQALAIIAKRTDRTEKAVRASLRRGDITLSTKSRLGRNKRA